MFSSFLIILINVYFLYIVLRKTKKVYLRILPEMSVLLKKVNPGKFLQKNLFRIVFIRTFARRIYKTLEYGKVITKRNGTYRR